MSGAHANSVTVHTHAQQYSNLCQNLEAYRLLYCCMHVYTAGYAEL